MELLSFPSRVDVSSSVSASRSERINRQIPPNAAPVLSDKSLEKSAVGVGYTLIPLPAFTYDRNEGSWIGALAPIFRANAKGQIEDIYAPLYLHNALIGDTFTFNYFGYRSETRQYHVILSHATKVERAVDLSYQDTGVDDGRYIVSLQANSGKSAFNRFFGFGNKVGEQKESNYAMGDSNLVAGGGVNLGRSVDLIASERYRRVSIENGVVSSLPQTINAFPTAPGIDGADIWGQAVTLSYDTRDNQLTPTKGTYATFKSELDQNFEPDNRFHWWRLTAEARNYLPHDGGRAVFVSHVLVDDIPADSKGLVRGGVPFYERPTLGGEDTLRAFGRGRFVGNAAVLLNLEERVSLMKAAIMGNVIEIEAAPFLDIGRVSKRLTSDKAFRNVQADPGFGLRLLARPNISSRLDVAYGRDGMAVFVGLDYPF
ncbi:MAG: BamA/TamA family outer membrane protein [Elusimicrobia bacterium]|nr:BamA/TamA family outer membrane protein [Elusimicrobiota bacterium]